VHAESHDVRDARVLRVEHEVIENCKTHHGARRDHDGDAVPDA
jgi:hypothetical protein